MKLDSKIIEGKKPFGCFDTEEAKKFIGKKCYFADTESCFENMDNDRAYIADGVLMEVSDTGSDPYRIKGEWFCYCLPLEYTKNVREKKFRPFTLDEFLAFAPLGETIAYRYKARTDPDARITALVIEVDHGDGKDLVRFGGNLWSFDEMFRDLEREYEGEWYPFGSAE